MFADTVLILANGEWEGAMRLRELADRADLIVAADGAWAKAVAAGIPVDRVIGDLDSLTDEQKASLRASDVEVQVHPADKDFTDLHLALDHALSLSPEKVIVFGAFGGRIDHTLANVLLLERAVARGVEVELIAGRETAWLIRGGFTLPIGRARDRVSLIPLSEEAVVRTDGLRYRLDDEPLVRASAHGISNVIEEIPVRIAVRSGTVLVVHGPADEPEGAGGR
jgi:thiamine pyrophosphokinase